MVLLIAQVAAIVLGGMAMFLEVRGLVKDVQAMKVEVQLLREADAKFEVLTTVLESQDRRIGRVEQQLDDARNAAAR
jgi:hypothetical protein